LKREIRRFRTASAMAAFAAGIFKKALLKKPGLFTAALPGGSTPLPLFDLLAGMELPWDRAVFLMTDERLVSASSPRSNFGAAAARFFSRVNIPRRNLLRAEARDFSRRLAAAAPGGSPDLVVLGLGADGHTASLFPGSPALKNTSPASFVTAPPGVQTRRRVTLTLKTINGAPLVILMAAGAGKKEMFARAAAGDKKIPAGLLNPRGKLYLLYSPKE